MKNLQKDVMARICRALRACLGWEQKQLSEKASVAISTVQSVESAKHETNASTIKSIQDTFEENGVSVSYDEEKEEVTIVYKIKKS